MQQNAGTVCVSECVLKDASVSGLHVGPLSGQKKTAQRQSVWAGFSWDIRDPDVAILLTLAWDVPGQNLMQGAFFLLV